MDEAMECRVLHTVALSQALSTTRTTHPSQATRSRYTSLAYPYRPATATPSDTAASFLVTIASHENTHGTSAAAAKAPAQESLTHASHTPLDARGAVRAYGAQLRARDATWRAWAEQGRARDVLRSSSASTAGLVWSAAVHTTPHTPATSNDRQTAQDSKAGAHESTSEPHMACDAAVEAVLNSPSVRIVYAQRSAFHALRRPALFHAAKQPAQQPQGKAQSAAEARSTLYTKSRYHVPLHLAPQCRATHGIDACSSSSEAHHKARTQRESPLEQLTRDFGAAHEARCSRQQRVLRSLRPPDVWDGTLPAYIALDGTPQLMDIDHDLAFSRVARVMHDTGAAVY